MTEAGQLDIEDDALGGRDAGNIERINGVAPGGLRLVVDGSGDAVEAVRAIFDVGANASRRAQLPNDHKEQVPLVRIWRDAAEPGHIYFVAAPELRRIKIGFTRDVERRFTSLLNSSPCDLFLIGSARGVPRAEEAMHLLLSRDRAKGEWFHETPSVLAAIEVALRTAGVRQANRAAAAIV